LLENIPRILPDHCAVELDMMRWEVLPVFRWLAHLGNIMPEEMLRTFNMGIGMVAIVDISDVEYIQKNLDAWGQKNYIIGTVISRSSDGQVIIKNMSLE
jgi:phosphoribosylaminoimidazole (AIR) synthetase